MRPRRKRRLFLEELESREVLSTFFVATTGNDSAAGTQAAPWLTLNHALSSVASGDTIDLRGGTYAGNVQVKTSNITLQSFPGEHAIVSSPTNNSSEGIVIWVEGDGFTLNDVEVTGGFYYGIKFELGLADGGTVENCKVHDTGDHCIKVQTNNMTFLNDEVYHSGLNTGTAGSRGIDDVNGSNMHVVQCYFHDINSVAFYAKGGVTGSLFERNLIVNCQMGLLLGGDTDTNLINATNNPNLYENIGGVARNNIIVNTVYAGIGLWAADNASVYNNTLINVAQSGQAGIFLRDVQHSGGPDTPCTNVTVINNIVSISPTGGRSLFDIHDVGTAALTGSLAMANNLYFAGVGALSWADDRNGETANSLTTWQTYLTSIGVTSNDSSSLVGDPLFDTLTNHLPIGSPAVDAGQTIASFSNDYFGTSRPQGKAWDIGAEEVIQSAPAVATHFSVTAPASTMAGLAFSLTVTALDSFNNTALTYTGTVHFTSSDGAAILPADYTFTATDAGLHTFSNAVTLKTAGSKSVTATDKTTSTITGGASLTVNPATTSQLQVSGFPSPTTASTSHAFTVTAQDPFGNAASSYTGTVRFTSSDTLASLPANYTFVGGDAGVHSFSATLNKVGTQSITTTDMATGSITGSQTGITVALVVATKFLVVGFPSIAVAGTSHNFNVTAVDNLGDIATSYTGTVTFSGSDVQAGLPADYTFTATDAGVHTFSATLKTAGAQSIKATDKVSSTVNGSETGIAVNPAAAANLVVTGYATPTTAGTSHNFTVTAKDAFGNTASGYSGMVTFTSSDPNPILPANYTFVGADAGSHSFSATLRTAGSQSITATDTVTSIKGSQGAITVNPAAASHFVISSFPSATTAGVSQSLMVTAQDAFNNLATGYSGTVTFSSSDSQASLPAKYSFINTDAGVHTFTATLKTAGAQSITVTDTVTSSVNCTRSGITVNPAAISKLRISVPGGVTAAKPFNVTVTAVDSFNNTVTSYLGTIHFTSSDGRGTLPANFTFSGADAGVHVFTSGATLVTSGSQTIAATDTVTSSITGQTAVLVNTSFAGLYGFLPAYGQWWVAASNGSSAFTNHLGTAWNSNVTWVDVQTGDFNGDGKSDIVGRDAQTGNWWVSLNNGSTFTTSLWGNWSAAATWVDVHVGDFNGDGKADIVGRYLQTGQWWMAQSTGSSFVNSLWGTWNPNVTWMDVKVGDFNGDKKTDITGRYLQGGQWWTALSTGSSFTTSFWAAWNPAVTWVDVNVADFNGDGKSDIVGRWLEGGYWFVGLSTGSSFTTSLWGAWNPAVTWVDVKVGDFNGDGKADIAGRWLQGGYWYVGLSTGSSFTTSSWDLWNPAVTWVDVQVGDFTGDGRDDIAGRYLQTGQWFVGISNGTTMFTNSLWDTWSPGVTWADVHVAKQV